ncbi:hypothetical protein TCAL_08161 [Tigriopus californicus]|uniref:Uncharacterized protein n=1 Tax=Tigriopus californicus TaxID=6832 RepID=A0A553P3T3_TIGCA|nr:hypothetical protein TCAL_08161 [Tigriopus californicus]
MEDNEIVLEKLFGPLSAFISRCEDLLQICYTNQQFMRPEAESQNEIQKVAIKYHQLIGNIKNSGRKCLDIDNEQLRNDFQVFKSEVHDLDNSLLKALKTSFDEFKNIREACNILDTFYYVSQRTRIVETYNICKEKILQELVESTIREKNNLHKRLNYLTKFYSNITVELMRFKGLMVKEMTLKSDVFGSKFFKDVQLDKIMQTDTIMSREEEKELKTIFAKLVGSRLEEPITGAGSTSQFLIQRSLNYDGLLDINFKRSIYATYMEAKALESIDVSIYGSRTTLLERQQSQLIEACHIVRLVTEYNVLMGRLSDQEKGIFRNRIIHLERRMWNGIYKITWQRLDTLRSWTTMCDETVLSLTKEVLEYKTVNKAIDILLKTIRRNSIGFEDMSEGQVSEFLDQSEAKINSHVHFCSQKVKSLGNYITKLESFLEVKDSGVAPYIWEDYVNCLEKKLAEAYETSIVHGLRNLIEILTGFRVRPMFKLKVITKSDGYVTVGEDFNEICDFLTRLPRILADESRLKLVNDRDIVLFGDENGRTSLMAIENSLMTVVEKAKRDVNAYFNTLGALQDFISLSPANVLKYYHQNNEFIRYCETDVHKLREMTVFLSGLQRRIWINLFVLEMDTFIDEHTQLMRKWEAEFIQSIAEAVRKKESEILEISKAVKKSLSIQEEVSKGQPLNKQLDLALEKMGQIKDITAMILRTDPKKAKSKESIKVMEVELENLKQEKIKAVDYFAKKREEDVKALQASCNEFEDELGILSKDFEAHAPFTLSWKSHEALADLEVFGGKIETLKNKERSNVNQASALELFLDVSSHLMNLESSVAELASIWKIVGEFEGFQNSLKDLQIMEDNLGTVSARLEEISGNLGELTKLEKYQDLEIFVSMKSSVETCEVIFKVIVAMMSPSLRSRHWEEIGHFLGTYDKSSILENKTYDEVISIFMEKSVVPVHEIVNRAIDEQNIELEFNDVKSGIEKLEPTFGVSGLGIASISNHEELLTLLREVLTNLQSLRTNPGSFPFREDLLAFENSVVVTFERIEYFVDIETDLNSLCETFSLFSLHLQANNLQAFLGDICALWQEVYGVLAEKVNVIDAMSEDVNEDLVVVTESIKELQKDATHLLKSRLSAFPRLQLYLLQAKSFNLAKVLSPNHIKRLVISPSKPGQRSEIIGFITFYDLEKKFTEPIRVGDVPVENVLMAIQEQSRSIFKREILESMEHFRHNKQERLIVSHHAAFVGRMVIFWTRLNTALGNDLKDFQKWLVKTYDIALGKVANLQALFASLKANEAPEDAIIYNRNLLGMELNIITVLCGFLQKIKDGCCIENLHDHHDQLVTYSYCKETGQIWVGFNRERLIFGYDETPLFDFIHYHKHVEKNVHGLLAQFSQKRGTILEGDPKCNRTTSLKYLALVLGRHLTVVNLFKYSHIPSLKDLLMILHNSLDLIALKYDTPESIEEKELYKLIQTSSSVAHEHQSNALGLIPEPIASRIFFICPKDVQVNLGKAFKALHAAEPNLKLIIKQCLQGFGIDPSVRMIQSIFVLSQLHSKSFSETGSALSLLHDKKAYKRSDAFQEIRDLFLDGDFAIRQIFNKREPFMKTIGHECINEIVEETFKDPHDANQFDSSLNETARTMKLTMNRSFKKQVELLFDTIQHHDILALCGPSMTGKTTSWQVVGAALDMDIHHLPTAMFFQKELCQSLELLLGHLASRRRALPRKTILIVLEGEVIPELLEHVLPLIRNSITLLSNGKLLIQTKVIKVIIETHDVKLVQKGNIRIPILKYQSHNLPFEAFVRKSYFSVFKLIHNTQRVLDRIDFHIRLFLECREQLGIMEEIKNNVAMVNNMLLMLKAVGFHNLDSEYDQGQTLIFVCLFCFGQDLPADQKDQMEAIIRKKLECADIPTDDAMCEYFYLEKSWKPYLSRQNPDSALLPKHCKALQIAKILSTALIPVEFIGAPNCGKTLIMQELAKCFFKDSTIHIQASQTTPEKILSHALFGSMEPKNKRPKSLIPNHNLLRIFIDDVSSGSERFQESVAFLLKYKKWLCDQGIIKFERTSFVISNTQNELKSGDQNHFRIHLEPLTEDDQIDIFQRSMKEFLSPFEMEVLFQMKKIIPASVKVNAIEIEGHERFGLHDLSRIIMGMYRANPDCQDTEESISSLWVHEIARTYRDKLQYSQHENLNTKVLKILKSFVGRNSESRWMSAQDIIYGNFINRYQFYTELDVEKVRSYLDKEIKAYNAANKFKLSLVPTIHASKTYSKLRRLATQTGGHVVIHGASELSLLSLVQLIASQIGANMMLILPSDLKRNQWQTILRSLVRKCGMENENCILFLTMINRRSMEDVCTSLESIINVGYDPLLFSYDEIQVMSEKENYLEDLRTKVKKNLHLFLDNVLVDSPAIQKFLSILNLAPNEDAMKSLGEEVLKDRTLPQELLLEMAVHQDIRSFNTFVQVFEGNFKSCEDFYITIEQDITVLLLKIDENMANAKNQIAQLGELRDKKKTLTTELGDMQKQNIKMKKEIEELDTNIESHLKSQHEDQLAIMRAQTLVGQEMAANYGLYQIKLNEINECLHHKKSHDIFLNFFEQEEAVAVYMRALHEVFGVDIEESEDKVRSLHQAMINLNESKIHEISENLELQALRKDLSSEVQSQSCLMDCIIDAHKRIESLAKVLKMKSSKFARIEILSKNVEKEEVVLDDLRIQKIDKEHEVKDNLKQIAILQKEISARSEKINILEQFSSDFKSTQTELKNLITMLKDGRSVVKGKISTLSGTLALFAAFIAYCGPLSSNERNLVVKRWTRVLRQEAQELFFELDFMRVPIQGRVKFNSALSYQDVPRIYENMTLLDFLPNPIVVIDPQNISIEYLFKSSKTGVIYCGDPDFDEEFRQFSTKFQSIIVRHFVFDHGIFQKTQEHFVRHGDQVQVYHVVNELNEDHGICPLNILDFELQGADLTSYILHHLKIQINNADPISEEDKIEKLKNRFEKIQQEIRRFLSNPLQLSELSEVKSAVDRIKKHLRDDNASDEILPPHLKSLEMASEVFADFYTTVLEKPFDYLRMAPLKKTIVMFQGFFEKINSQNLSTHQDVALVVAEQTFKAIMPHLVERDFITLSIQVIFFLYLCETDSDARSLSDLLDKFPLVSSQNIEGFALTLKSFDQNTFVCSSLRQIVKLLLLEDYTKLFDHVHASIAQLFKVHHVKECNLEKIYSLNQSKTIVIHSDKFIQVLEIIGEFAQRVGVDSPIVLHTLHHNEEMFWILEEALFEGHWVVFQVDAWNRNCLNYVRFLLEKCAAKTSHANFRSWIICPDLETFLPLTSMTVPINCISLEEMEKDRIYSTNASETQERYPKHFMRRYRKKIIERFRKILLDINQTSFSADI